MKLLTQIRKNNKKIFFSAIMWTQKLKKHIINKSKHETQGTQGTK